MTEAGPEAPADSPKRRSAWLAAFSDGPGMSREIFIVVVGVLLAFAVDRGGEAWATRQRTQAAEAALSVEVETSLLHAAEVVAYADCRRARVVRMAAAVRAGEPSPVRLGLTSRPWTSAVWRSTLASGAAEELPRHRLIAYSRLYGGFEALFQRQFVMRDHLFAARVADFPGVTASDRAQAATHLSVLDADLMISRTIAAQMLEIARTDLGLAPPPQPVARFVEAAATTCARPSPPSGPSAAPARSGS
ncbi:hypothetical protein [Brevundimonas sp.]|uniref:hypothetical protein n=1 Tax=Brevundimonas sp. TaxID=1871086 RepID=UPI002D3AE98C|nr:hypothetical protein [Brevundimonas sp.]HYC66975.1 hypothetical protein [Brevundimonas sp.]